MVYQAVIEDKVPVLDVNNIVHLQNLRTSDAGRGIAVVFQPDARVMHVEPGEVLLLKKVPKAIQAEGLLTADMVSSHFDENGSTTTVNGRLVRDTLDPYGYLAERF